MILEIEFVFLGTLLSSFRSFYVNIVSVMELLLFFKRMGVHLVL